MTAVLLGSLAVFLILVVGTMVFSQTNAHQFNAMSFDQQIRLLMKQANSNDYFKNISEGSQGKLVYIKNKRKIFVYPWVLVDGKMLCTRKRLYKNWDYPENHPPFTDEEAEHAMEELNNFNRKSVIKLYFPDES